MEQISADLCTLAFKLRIRHHFIVIIVLWLRKAKEGEQGIGLLVHIYSLELEYDTFASALSH